MNKNIKQLILLCIPAFFGIQIQASTTSETITITNKSGGSIWVSTEFDLTKAHEIKDGRSKQVTLSQAGICAFIAKQELPFSAVGSIGSTLSIMFFKNGGTFYVYNQNFIVKDDGSIDLYNAGIADPLNKLKFGTNQIIGNQIYIYNNGNRTATGLIATDSSTSPF